MNSEAAALSVTDTLDGAAYRLNQLLNDTTTGPWWSDEDEYCWRLHGVAGVLPGPLPGMSEQVVNKQILKAPKRDTPYAEYWPEEADAQWITTMNPVVGKAIVGWLTHVADEAREHRDHLDGMDFPATEAVLACAYFWPLRVARAILGQDPGEELPV